MGSRLPPPCSCPFKAQSAFLTPAICFPFLFSSYIRSPQPAVPSQSAPGLRNLPIIPVDPFRISSGSVLRDCVFRTPLGLSLLLPDSDFRPLPLRIMAHRESTRRERERTERDYDGAQRRQPPRGDAPAPTRRQALNEYFVDGDGIDREVLQSEICKFLRPEATSRPGEYNVRLVSNRV